MGDQIQTCGPDRRPIPVAQRGKHLVVDIHCHLNVAPADVLVRTNMIDPPPAFRFSSPASDAVTGRLFAAIGPKLNGIDARIADMDHLGVDVQAISPSPGQYYYYAPPELGRDAATLINDTIASAVARFPDRLVGMGTVPLQQVHMAIAEMRRCVDELGLRGIEINSHVNGRELAAPEFRPFWAAAEEMGILVFMHPLGFSHGERLAEHYLNNILGNPIESTIAVSHLIFGGVLKDHPGIKLCIAHGGGYLPGYWGRMDHAFHAREDCRQHIDEPPSHYLRRLWFDTLVFDRSQLEWLVRTHGADRLCLGSDYPFDMSEPLPVEFHSSLDEESQAKILGLNAADLLGLEVQTGGGGEI